MSTLAHLSDLHLGESPLHQQRAARLVDALLDEAIDHVVITGDITHSGTIDEYELYLALFRPLREAGKLTVIPGNHDRSGDDVAELLSDELRVSVDAREGLFMVCVDSTAPHHRDTFLGGATYRSHGELGEQMLAAVDEALTLAPPRSVRCACWCTTTCCRCRSRAWGSGWVRSSATRSPRSSPWAGS
jgi:DNA repair exonuclease SbcCD nuclease subunit